MGITAPLNHPLYSGGSTQISVPGVWDVAIDGVPYMIDWNRTGTQYAYRTETKPLLRNQADDSAAPGEHSLSADGLWRRAIESWHGGAGQAFYDRPNASPARFRQSKGIDPWTRWEFSLLPETVLWRSSSNSNLYLARAGSRIYFSDGQTLGFTTDLDAETAVTGTHASTVQAIASDGVNVYAAYGDGIGKTDTSTSAISTAWNALVASKLGYVKGRLMAVGAGADTHILYNVTASGAAPSALFTAGNTEFEWVGFAEGRNVIYAAGSAGDKSLIYRITVVTDGTTLGAPVIAGELPDGEIIRSIQGYLGFLMIGTDNGVRFAIPDDDGDLTIGAQIETASSVQCFEPQGRFVWFGWTNYDATSTGLGRMDLTTINDGTTPAYASDLMATDSGAVVGAATLGDLRAFSVATGGFYRQGTDLVAEGTLDSGFITYELPEEKTVASVDVRHEALATDGAGGSHSAELTDDGVTYSGIGTHVPGSVRGEQFVTGNFVGEHIEVRSTLTRGTDEDTGPTITRITVKALPRANSLRSIQVPLIMSPIVQSKDGSQQFLDTNAMVDQITALRRSQDIVQYQEFISTFQVVVEDFVVEPEKTGRAGELPVGTLIVRMKTLDI